MFDDTRHLIAAMCMLLLFLYYFLAFDQPCNRRNLDLHDLYKDDDYKLHYIMHYKH
jgi:hypothetical protein